MEEPAHSTDETVATADAAAAVRPDGPPLTSWQRWRRPLLVLALLLGLFVAARLTGLGDDVDAERVRAAVQAAGAWGLLLFVVVFAAGELVHIPGIVFVGAAVAAYGTLLGTLASLVGAMGSVTASFFVVRTLGGQPLAGIDNRRMRAIMAHLDRRPIRTVALLRLVFWMAPALNYALAMSSVRPGHYLAGSALGLLLPVTAAGCVLGWWLA